MAALPGPERPGPLAQARLIRPLERDPAGTMLALHRDHGPVVEIGFGPMRYVFLFGREANEHLLATDPANFEWRPAMKALIPVDGDTALVVTDGEDHRRRRRLVQPAFNTKRINGYVEVMVDELRREAASWSDGATVDLYAALRPVIRRIVARALFGDRLRGQADELGARLEPALRFVNLPLSRQLKIDVPGTSWRAAKRARESADELVYAEIAWRRAHGNTGDDVLSWLLETDLSDEELRDQVVSLIAAGYDTTSAAAGWMLWRAASEPGVWARAREEADGPGTQSPYVAGVVNEALRLHPPGLVGGRRAREPFEVLGHHVPGGRIVLYSPYVTQRLPELWPDPEAFRPGRWVEGDPDFREPEPYSFVPFGGGYRRCIGFALATLELKVVLAELVRMFDIELVDPSYPGHTGIAAMSPRAGVQARVHRTSRTRAF